MVQTQGQRGDLHQYSHPYKINRDRGIELLAESMDANQELASDDPWASFQETENWSVWEVRVVISGMNSCSHWFEVCRLRLSSATSDLTIPIESVTIKSTVRIQCKHLVLSTSIALPRKRPLSHVRRWKITFLPVETDRRPDDRSGFLRFCSETVFWTRNACTKTRRLCRHQE